MKEILGNYRSISLDEMSGIRLMNRTDTKFVTNVDTLRQLLTMAVSEYRVQEIEGKRIAPYYTVYFDTTHYSMYMAHQDGITTRQKLRIRSYVDSHLNFLEIKNKNNHGRTRKKRISITGFDPCNPDHNIRFTDNTMPEGLHFLKENLRYDTADIEEKLENHFNRITLVNNRKTERLTIDTGLCFNNLETDISRRLDNIAVIELKRDGLAYSPILNIMRMLRIKPMGFSKYVMGEALTNPMLKKNRLKQRIHKINILENGNVRIGRQIPA